METKEIVTKTILSKNSRQITDEILIEVEDCDALIGCWVLNYQLDKQYDDQQIYIHGQYELHLWTSVHNKTSTKLIVHPYHFEHAIPLEKPKTVVFGEMQCMVHYEHVPTVVKGNVEQKRRILLAVESEIGVQWIGETKIRVGLMVDEIDDEIDQAVDPYYLKNKK